MILSGCVKKTEEKGENTISKDPGKQLVEEIEGYRGRERVVAKEEYDFYRYFVDREVYQEISEEEFEERVQDYTNEVSAIFYLGNQLGICEPYDFSTLKLRWTQENESRKIKKEKGEAIYGLEQYTLETYFQYLKDQVELDLLVYIQKLESQWILEQAEAFYLKYQDNFKYREEVIYEIETNGKTESLTADADDISFFSKADGGLADFLVVGEPGEKYSDTYNEEERSITIKEVIYNKEGFENNQEAAVTEYITNELYPYLIETVAEQNPVKLEE